MLNNLLSFQNINFGNLWGMNFAAPIWEFPYKTKGEVFVFRSNWVTRGSTISFDDGAEIKLVPKQPYFVSFNHRIVIRMVNPFMAMGAATIVESDDLEATVFNKAENYYESFYDTQPYSMIIQTDNNVGFRIQPTLGAKYCHVLLKNTDVTKISCAKVCKAPTLGAYSNQYRPCIGYLTFDHTGASGSGYNYDNDEKILSVELNGEELDFQPIYWNGVYYHQYHLVYSDVGNEQYNESILYDRQPGLVANTTYVWTYQIPKHAKNLFYRFSDNVATPYQNLWFTVNLPQTSILTLATGAGVTSIGGALTNWGSACKLRIVILTNLANPNDLTINVGWRN